MTQLYRHGIEAFKLDSRNPASPRKTTKAMLERKAMESDCVAVTVMSSAACDFQYRDYIVVDGRPYFLNNVPEADKTDFRLFSYDLRFEGGMYELGRVFFTMTGLHGWDYIGTLYDFCLLVVNDMNRGCLSVKVSTGDVVRYTGRRKGSYYVWQVSGDDTTVLYSSQAVPYVGSTMLLGDLTPGPSVTQVGGAWSLDFETTVGAAYGSEERSVIETVVATEEKSLTYDGRTCLEVLNDLMSQWEEWEYAVVVKESDLCNIDGGVQTQCGGKIVLRRKAAASSDTTKGIYLSDNTVHANMSFGKKGGISKIKSKSKDCTNLPSRIFFFGGSNNLPTTYRNTRLCLPGASKEKSHIDTGFENNSPCEAVKVFDDIYPACEPFKIEAGQGMTPVMIGDNRFTFSILKSKFFNLYARWHSPDDTNPYSYGSYAEWKKIYGTGDATSDRQRYMLYYYCGAASGSPIAGFPKSCYLTDEQVTITFQTGELAGHSFVVTDFESVEDEYEITLACESIESLEGVEQHFPNGDIMCSAGDRFTVEGCMMPASMVYGDFGSGDYAAEKLLQDQAEAYIDQLSNHVKVGIEISLDYIVVHNAVFRMYDRIQLSDTDLLGSSMYYRVDKVVWDMLEGTYNVEIGDGNGTNPWKHLSESMRKITGGNGKTVVKKVQVGAVDLEWGEI